ncbi:MAG: asparagine synthase C-terminal domain-containing protein [Gemmataceae bacterium]
MDCSSFLGGIWKRNALDRSQPRPPSSEAVREDWGWIGERSELFLRGAPALARLFTWDGLALLFRGYARRRGSSCPLDLDRIAEEIRCHYLEHGDLDVDDLDGSFTVALCDSAAERVILYRNLIGSGFTYYRASGDGLLFGGNLVELLDLGGNRPEANRDVLPDFFLFRCVPGRETLFNGVERLLPGEEVCWEGGGITRRQRHTFASLMGHPIGADEAVDAVEATLRSVLADGKQHRPGAANLLSGGVDSSYLQTIWNGLLRPETMLPTSYSVSVDHPGCWADTDYALSASHALGTRHVLVPADAPYQEYFLDALASTGEPPNHVQSAYFGHLARAMKAEGVTAGICGEGADSLFGLGLSNQVHNARILRSLAPGRLTRSLGGAMAGLLGWDRLAFTFAFADRLEDWSWFEHPINRVAAFTDWKIAEDCFGRAALLDATARRRDLLDRYALPRNPLDRVHAAGFLGEAMDSAGLWSTMFHRAGADLLCPFLDSRVLRLALNLPPQVRYKFRRPKDALKRALKRRAPAVLATRSKLGFGQPIFEWLREGGQLRPMVEGLGEHPFVEPAMLQRLRSQPNWFLYSLVVYDTWHRLFIDRSLASPGRKPEAATALGVLAGSAV